MIKIEIAHLNDIIPYKNNVKKHPEKQLEQIIKSIKLFGYNAPIAIYEKR